MAGNLLPKGDISMGGIVIVILLGMALWAIGSLLVGAVVVVITIVRLCLPNPNKKRKV